MRQIGYAICSRVIITQLLYTYVSKDYYYFIIIRYFLMNNIPKTREDDNWENRWNVVEIPITNNLTNIVEDNAIFLAWKVMNFDIFFFGSEASVDFKVLLRLVFWFYRSNLLRLFCSPLHVHFSTIKHLLLALVYKK